MKLQCYQEQDRNWNHVLDYERHDDEQVRLHAAYLGRIAHPKVIGFRVLDNLCRLVAHWNPEDGWVNHHWAKDDHRKVAAPNDDAMRPEEKDYRSPRSVKRAKRQKRPCLCCKRPFMSEGAHNRLCKNCRTLPEPPEVRTLAI